jgi:hypothetical protein
VLKGIPPPASLPAGANCPARNQETSRITSLPGKVQILLTQINCRSDEGREWRACSLFQASDCLSPSDGALRLPMQMQELASIISIAAVVVFSLGLAVALMLAWDGVFRGRGSMGFEAIIYTAAIVALVCAIIWAD